MTQLVITYHFANLFGTTSLCEPCASTKQGLGGVSHGQHDGECDLCDPEDRQQPTEDRQESGDLDVNAHATAKEKP